MYIDGKNLNLSLLTFHLLPYGSYGELETALFFRRAILMLYMSVSRRLSGLKDHGSDILKSSTIMIRHLIYMVYGDWFL